MSEKTEKPTPKKLRDARKKGQIGQSQDIPKLLIVAVLLEVVISMAETGINHLQQLVAAPVSLIAQPFEYGVRAVTQHCLTIAGSLIMMALGIAVLMRLAGAWLQFGFLFAPEALKIDFNRLNPVSQIKNMFSGKKLFELLNSLLKATALSCIIYLQIPSLTTTLLKLPFTTLNMAWHGIAQLFSQIEHTCLMALLALAAIDFGMQKYFYLKGLKMSKDDVKQEFKDSEGDPHAKGHRRSEAKRLASEGGPVPQKKPELEDADALIVNPTHFAVGLYYRADQTPLPKIVCKGMDDDALDLIAQAKEKQIPVIRFIWLARTLYKQEAGSYIPRETLRYVAKIYQAVKTLEQDAILDGELHIPDLETL
ncbi:type III secretion system export apparatus subunit SctU [Vibrio quintilis]|uniref:Yop proteins translocation protein U n=1 Tax=Vibrio quintilis TaxID=1117707 RepID=A0A1M7YSY0_9VIBR|nr:type III secretion system export apparatus subunit SctU [Vibrio quintilis]SHO55646.1 Yop proteins translocation protein U [Vibrio quintilis]